MKRLGTRRIVNLLTIRAGEIVYDRDGRAFADWGNTRGSASVPPLEPTKQPTGPSGVVAPADPIYDLLLKNGIVIDPSSGRHGASTLRSWESASRASRSTCRRTGPEPPWTPAPTTSHRA